MQTMINFKDAVADGWEQLRISSEYTKKQKDSLKALQKVFSQCFNQELKGTLLESNEQDIPVQNNAFLITQLGEARNPNRVVSDSPLCSYANSLLLDIAQYLKKRDSGSTNPIYPNDPIHLFCLHMTDWIKIRLMRAECKKDTLNEVRAWKKFLKQILDDGVFSYCERPNTLDTLNVAISNIQGVLENVYDYIELELSRNTIEKELLSLLNSGKNYLNFCFEYLLYVLNDRKNVPCNFSIVNINISNLELLPEIQDFISNTKLGACLAILGQKPAIRELFVPASSKRAKDIQEQATAVISQDGGRKTVFLLENGDSQIQLVELLAQSTLLGSISSGLIDFKLSARYPNWNTEEKHTAAVKHFVKFCGLLEIFAQILLHCREAAYLSGKTGDLLLCKLTKQQLKFLTESFEQLAHLIQQEVTTLNQIVSELNTALIRNNQSQTIWQNNYKTANKLFEKIEDLYKSDDSFFSHTKVIDNSIKTLNKQIEETHHRLILFVEDINQTASQQHWLAPNCEMRKLPQKSQFPLLIDNKESSKRETPPKKVANKAIELDSLQKSEFPRIANGNIPLEAHSLFKVRINDFETYLLPIVIPKNPDCVFQALEIEREEIIPHLLAECVKNESLWKFLAPEVKMLFKNKPLPSAYVFLDSYATYNQTLNLELLDKYCLDLSFMAYFINDYYLKSNGGVIFQENHSSLLDAISVLAVCKIYVWKHENGRLKLVNRPDEYSKNMHPPKHLLWIPSQNPREYSEFQCLLDIQYPLSNSSLLSIADFSKLPSKILFTHVKLLEDGKEYFEAIQILNILISREPENSLFFFMRGRNLMQTNLISTVRLASKDFELALEYSFDDTLNSKILSLQKEAISIVEKEDFQIVSLPDKSLLLKKAPELPSRITKGLEAQLLKAATENDLEACQDLINKGVSLTIQDDKGNTIFHLTTNPTLVELFLKHGLTTINYKNLNGISALYHHTFIACVKPKITEKEVANSIAIIKLLLAAGADPNTQCKDKKTPMFLALQDKIREHEALIQLFSLSGTNFRARDKSGNHAINCSSGHTGVFDSLGTLSRMTDECIGEQAARGMQAFNKAKEHELQLEPMEKKCLELEEKLKAQEKEMLELKRQMRKLELAVSNQTSRQNAEPKSPSQRFF